MQDKLRGFFPAINVSLLIAGTLWRPTSEVCVCGEDVPGQRGGAAETSPGCTYMHNLHFMLICLQSG